MDNTRFKFPLVLRPGEHPYSYVICPVSYYSLPEVRAHRIKEARGERTAYQIKTLAAVSVPNHTECAGLHEDVAMKDVDEYDNDEWTGFSDNNAQGRYEDVPEHEDLPFPMTYKNGCHTSDGRQTDEVVENAAVGLGDPIVRNREGSVPNEPLEGRKVADDNMVCFIVFIVLLREYC